MIFVALIKLTHLGIKHFRIKNTDPIQSFLLKCYKLGFNYQSVN